MRFTRKSSHTYLNIIFLFSLYGVPADVQVEKNEMTSPKQNSGHNVKVVKLIKNASCSIFVVAFFSTLKANLVGPFLSYAIVL